MTQPLLAWLSWYALISLLGLTCLPLAFRLFRRLPDGGYGFSKPLGLLALGYLVWLGATVGLLPNTASGQLSAWLLLAGVNLWLLRGHRQALSAWLRRQSRTVLVVEGLFLLAFALWAFVRAHSPEILGTEKPMELAFLNSVVHSNTLPPADPWLSGHAISYYYFGYVLAGTLTSLSGVAAPIAFNLTGALWFALSAVAAYAVTDNLIRLRTPGAHSLAGLLGSLMVTVMGNLEGFLEILHARQLFWVAGPDGQLRSALWQWLDLKNLDQAPIGDPGLLPTRFWWWWRASRVVRDVNQAGVDIEVIDEFPFFSFVLADIHPHVLALPFVLLALGVVLLLFTSSQTNATKAAFELSGRAWRVLVAGTVIISLAGVALGGWISAAAGDGFSLGPLLVAGVIAATFIFIGALLTGRLQIPLNWGELLFAGWVFGALAFLNAWDFPIYLGLLFFVMVYKAGGRPWRGALQQATSAVAAVGLMGVAFFALWYPTFSSQAGGIAPNLGFPTKIQHFVIMFAPLLAPVALWLFRLWRRRGLHFERIPFLRVVLGAPLALFGLSWLLAGAAVLLRGQQAIAAAVDQLGAVSVQAGLVEALMDRLRQPWTALLLGALLAICWLALRQSSERAQTEQAGQPPLDPLVLILIATGGLLVLAPEFVYLLDLFGTRMNTVFKFYFAAWIMWGIAGAYALYTIKGKLGWPGRLLLLPLLFGLCYPVMATLTRTEGFRAGAGLSLDGGKHIEVNQPADAAAIDWINRNLQSGVVAEATGGSYSEYGRIATYTPLVTVLGWDWHEIQWRGSAEPQGTRRADIERLYQTPDWREARDIVERYQIDYVYVGPLERASYGAIPPGKFEAFMTPIYIEGEVLIYATPDASQGG